MWSLQQPEAQEEAEVEHTNLYSVACDFRTATNCYCIMSLKYHNTVVCDIVMGNL